MKIKKIISSVLALSMTMSMACTTAFAFDYADISGQSTFVYTDKPLQTYEGIATTESNVSGDGIAAMALSESDGELKPYDLGYIEAKRNPLISINDSINDTDDVLGYYSVKACTNDYYENEVVDELVVALTGLSYGDRIMLLIEDRWDEPVAYYIIDGKETPGVLITFPVDDVGEYNITVVLASKVDDATDDNSNVSYTLQVASRYVHATQQFYAHTTSIKYSGYEDWSEAGHMYIRESDAPSSAIVDSLFVNGTLFNTKTGKQAHVGILVLSNGTKEIAGSCPDMMENIDRFEIPLVGTWTIKYTPHLYGDNPHVLKNFSARIDFTYDISVG